MSEFPWDDYINDHDPYVHGRHDGEPDRAMIIIVAVSIILFFIAMGIFLFDSESNREPSRQQIHTENSI